MPTDSDQPDSSAGAPQDAPNSDADGRSDDFNETPEPIDMLAPLFREEPLRPEGGEAPPMWLWMIIFGVILFNVYYLGSYVGDFSTDPWLQGRTLAAASEEEDATEVTVDGGRIYNNRCQSCHQADGQGVSGQFPPLVESDWVTGDKGRLIRILLHGMEGPMEVLGEEYNGVMPSWQNQLDDAEIAAVLTHIRSEWENDASEVTADEVAALREAESERSEAWSAEELNDTANQGFPEGADLGESEEEDSEDANEGESESE
ncbi:MAG: cytochrome c [Longimonas sp.]|uniref:c-type cytochrome n=1 Tax=Longimonas sp. TaxID=2039626 RepID=UPI0039766EFC